MFVNSDLAGDKSTSHTQAGVLIFINRGSINWYRKRHKTVEAITFVENICATKAGVEMVEDLHYKVQMFGGPIDGSTNVLYDKNTLYKNNITPAYVLNKKHNIIAYHRYREVVTSKTTRVVNQVTEKDLAEIFTKIIKAARRRLLLEKFTY